ncbi:F-box protein At5g07610-like [Rutidosis leptorrhynchoides]|uniref:F-box protein At5g07610-like n=1 Tax=Rutidosis leptorrhynchoides TaxID=125765 RepID=UPI003A993220
MNTEAKFKMEESHDGVTYTKESDVEHGNEDDSITHHSNNQSAELIGSNVDLLTKILVSLPAKSILRFKSVSKQWLSILTHPRFIPLFHKLFNSSGLYYHELHVSFDVENPTTPPFRTLDFYPDTNGIRIVQSCNGLLLCCCDKNEYEFEYEVRGNYYVFNPTTKKFSLIPPVIESPDAEELIRFMGLPYHPIECVNYKLVCILRAGYTPHGQGFNEDTGGRMYNIQIYLSDTGKWKKLNQTFTPYWYTEFKYGVYWNGAFHWAPSCRNPMYLRLDAEQLQELPLPSPLPVTDGCYGYPVNRSLYFGESRGHLHLVEYSHENNPSSMNVYEMWRDHSGWFIKYQLDFHQLFDTYPNITHTRLVYDNNEFRVLDVVRGEEEEEDTFILVKVLDNIMRYNIHDKSFQHLCKIPKYNIVQETEGCFSKAFGKTFHPFVGHRYIEKIGPF